MMRSPTTILIVCSIFALYSCIEEQAPQERTEIRDGTPSLTKSSGSSNYYETLPNPYSLDVMQEVYDIYSDSGVCLEPTDLYVKFMPKDSLELHILKYDYGLELFDYPLDIILEEGDIYVEQNIPDTDLTWVYTTVSPDFVFPNGISYEILEQCYIPEESETVSISTKGGSEISVEAAAFALLGYDFSTPTTRAYSSSPSGTIEVDVSSGVYQPVKGVKVRCHTFVKWCTAYTNESGEYTMPKNFRTNVHYAIVFDNIKGFDIWGNWGPIARANHNMGWYSNTGKSVRITNSCNAWDWAVVNNSAYEYYKMCENQGLLKPPTDLKIWVFRNAERSSAPMLRRINHEIGLNSNSAWLNFFANLGYGLTATKLNQILRVALPDITIGCQSRQYDNIYESVCHELAHASHFSKVGSAYWAEYISYIMTYGCYGNGSGYNAELCAVGEMWGYFMGCALNAEQYGAISYNTSFPYAAIDGWIYPHILWHIYQMSWLTKKQIYDCLTPDVDTYDELANALYNKNPSKASNIRDAFELYNITPNLALPQVTNVSDMTYNTSSSITGEHINLQSIIVTNGAKLTITGTHTITIEKPFEVEFGSELEIYKSY